MSVEKIMSRQVVTIGPEERVQNIHHLFRERGFHHVVVLNGDHVVGVISDRDLLLNVSMLTRDKTAAEVMSRDVITIEEESSLAQAANLMLTHSISCLPVVKQGSLRGIVTSRDLLRELTR